MLLDGPLLVESLLKSPITKLSINLFVKLDDGDVVDDDWCCCCKLDSLSLLLRSLFKLSLLFTELLSSIYVCLNKIKTINDYERERDNQHTPSLSLLGNTVDI